MKRDPIPYTPFVDLYKTKVSKESHEKRLLRAEGYCSDPSGLATMFSKSIEGFSHYENSEDFYGRRAAYTGHKGFANTRQLAALLETKGPRWTVKGPKGLNFEYVDREIVLARTTGGAVYNDRKRSKATTGVRADLLLVSSKDRRPIVGEVKIGTDKDPFTGLIQGLACATQLATPNQLDRLHETYSDAEWSEDGLVYVYVILASVAKKVTPRARYWWKLMSASDAIAKKLMQEPEVRRSLAGIACLEILEVRKPQVRTIYSYPRDGQGKEYPGRKRLGWPETQ